MRVVLVLGYKLLPSGEISPKFNERLNEAVSVFRREKCDKLLIVGGETRAGFASEAETAYNALPESLKKRTILEKKSKSTAEAIRFSKEILKGNSIVWLVIVTSRYHIPRARHLLKVIWPKIMPKTEFVGVGTPGFADLTKEAILYILAFLDPEEQYVLPILKKFFRNG